MVVTAEWLRFIFHTSNFKTLVEKAVLPTSKAKELLICQTTSRIVIKVTINTWKKKQLATQFQFHQSSSKINSGFGFCHSLTTLRNESKNK